MKNEPNSFLKKAIDLMRSSYKLLIVNSVSLFIILIVLVLTVKVDQGQALIIDLIHHQPAQVIFLFFQVFFLALIISHYPTYIEFHTEDAGRVKWLLNKPIFMGVGFVTFTSKHKAEVPTYCDAYFEKQQKNFFKENFRKFLGLIFYTCIIYVFVITYYNQIIFFEWKTSNFGKYIFTYFWAILLIMNMLLFVVLNRLRLDKTLQRVVWPIFLSLLILCIIATIVSFFVISKSRWSGISVVVISITLYLFSLLYIWFISYRIPITCKIFSNKKNSNQINLLFIQLIAVTGIISVGVHVLTNIYPDNVSPLVLILAILHVIYGSINIIIKHYIYYTHCSENNPYPNIGYVFKNSLWLFPMVFFIWYAIAEYIGNDLHELKPKPFDPSKAMNWTDYETRFDGKFKDKNDTLYMIAAYGGGLKANLWNLYVLDTLDKRGILDKTIAISGVSGGSLGNAIYAALRHEYTSESDRRKRIDAIGKGNFLTSDIAYLFGHDFISNFFGTWILPRGNRSIRSLQHYQEIILDGKNEAEKNKLLTLPFQEYWAEMNRENDHYPVLILNSAGNNLRRGVACSINMSDTMFLECFNNADNILALPTPNTSLSYFEAMSTSNRFPILSPAAKIVGKGHYVDGGYFENSGMSSLLDFYFFLKQKGKLGNHPIKIIQISNSKGVNIHNLLNKKGENKAIVKRTIKERSEIKTMYDAKIQLDYTPFYYSELLDVLERDATNQLRVFRIDMPHYIEQKDVADMYNAKEVFLEKRILDSLESNNLLIRKIRGEQHVFLYLQPPLSRLLGEQSLNYMKIMLKKGNAIPKGL